MKDWRNSGVRPFIDRKDGCRRCSTSGGLHKIKEAVWRTARRLRDAWNRRLKRRDHQDEHK